MADFSANWSASVRLVKPIFKSGDKCNVANYWLICLLPAVSKVLERIIYNNVIDYVCQHNLPSSFVFLPLVLFLSSSWLISVIDKAFENNDSVDCIYLDFCKAFDSVPHAKLLQKLLDFGFTGELWAWFQAYLFSRRQCVCVEDTLSDFLPVLSGVLQAALLVHCSSLFILMTFLLVVACHPIFSYLLMTRHVLTGYPLLLIVSYFRRRLMMLLRGMMSETEI